jgi:PAS domain S-box-containing protein
MLNDPQVDQLHERVADLEAANANLRLLDETLRRNAHLFEALVNKSKEAFLLVTPRMTVLRLVHSVLGYSDADMAGQPMLSVIHPDDREMVSDCFSRLLLGQAKAECCETRARRKDGAWMQVDVEMTDMLDDPDIQAIVLNCRSIREK